MCPPERMCPLHARNMVRDRSHRALTILIAIVAGAAGAAFAQKTGKPAIAVQGRFTNMRYTDEHAYGYSVELWRGEMAMMGLFLTSEGLQGDNPAGLLEKVSFDANTGALSFEARLSTGVVYSKEHDGVPSRDLFRFTGVLKGRQLRGRLERLDMLDPQPSPKTEQIVLRREGSASGMTAYESYAEWKKAMDEILKFRGPKW